jgi:hypothetical protein
MRADSVQKGVLWNKTETTLMALHMGPTETTLMALHWTPPPPPPPPLYLYTSIPGGYWAGTMTCCPLASVD